MSPPFDNHSRLREPAYRLSNNPDIALAQEWVEQLDQWYEQHGLEGFDPFDIKQHPRIRAVQQRPFMRRATTVLTDLAPLRTRQWLHVRPTQNPKAYALMAHASLRMFRLSGEAKYRDRAVTLLTWLIEHPAQCDFLCWGYPFDVRGRGVDTPAGTPVAVVSAIAGQAFLEAHEVLHDRVYREAAEQIGHFFLEQLPQMPQQDGGRCFAYTPSDRRRVHNANLLVAEHLFALSTATGDASWTQQALPALNFSLSAQREDGAWPYGAWTPGDAYEKKLMALVDHHHSGFVLRSLHAIYKITQDPGHLDALRRGYEFYRKLVSSAGMPLNEHGAWPVDIHACAEAILCPSSLEETLPAARGCALLALRWAHFYMREPASGAPYYRKYPLFTSRIALPRWGVAWIYRALAEYLWRHYPTGARRHLPSTSRTVHLFPRHPWDG